jgi:hypothetical protein
MHIRCRHPYVRPLCDNFRRKAQGHVLWKSQAGEIENLTDFIGRVAADERGKAVALEGELLFEKGEVLTNLRQRRILRGNVSPRCGAGGVLAFDQQEILRFEIDDFLRGGDLAAERSLLRRRLDEIGDEREPRGVIFEPPAVGLRL